jgi:hypothetical protein
MPDGCETRWRILCVFPHYAPSFGTFEYAFPLMDGVQAFMPPQGLLVAAASLPASWRRKSSLTVRRFRPLICVNGSSCEDAVPSLGGMETAMEVFSCPMCLRALKISTVEPHPTRDRVDVMIVPVPDPRRHLEERHRQPS